MNGRRSLAFGTAARGAAAVEFALVLPLLLLLVFGVFAASVLMATVNGLEQISAGAARSSVAGQTDAERTALVNAYVAGNVTTYPYLDAKALTVTSSGNATTRTFTVRLVYDLSGNQILAVVKSLIPGLPSSFTRSAVVIEGGA